MKPRHWRLTRADERRFSCIVLAPTARLHVSLGVRPRDLVGTQPALKARFIQSAIHPKRDSSNALFVYRLPMSDRESGEISGAGLKSIMS